jgi:hypothetical protein
MNREKAAAGYAHAAMIKFGSGDPMVDQDWDALSWLTLINREHLYFGPGNVRWATGEAERISNISFYITIASDSNFYGRPH